MSYHVRSIVLFTHNTRRQIQRVDLPPGKKCHFHNEDLTRLHVSQHYDGHDVLLYTRKVLPDANNNMLTLLNVARAYCKSGHLDILKNQACVSSYAC